jgi:hypothetical protein
MLYVDPKLCRCCNMSSRFNLNKISVSCSILLSCFFFLEKTYIHFVIFMFHLLGDVVGLIFVSVKS